MSELLKLKFEPCVDIDYMEKGYIVNVEYVDASIVGKGFMCVDEKDSEKFYTLKIGSDYIELYSQNNGYFGRIITFGDKLIRTVSEDGKAVRIISKCNMGEALTTLKNFELKIKKYISRVNAYKESRELSKEEWLEQQPFEITL